MPITPVILHVDVAPPASIAITTPVGPNYAVYYYTGTITVPDYGRGSVYYFVVGAENFINAIGNEDYAYIYATVDGTTPASFNLQSYCLYPRSFEYYPPLDKYLEILGHGFGAGYIGPGILTVKIVVYTGYATSGISPNFNIQRSIPGTLNNLSVGVVAYPWPSSGTGGSGGSGGGPAPGPPVLGCTNPLATNYNPAATQDNNTCIYPAAPILGCMDPNAKNYNPAARVSDDSCRYYGPGDPPPTLISTWTPADGSIANGGLFCGWSPGDPAPVCTWTDLTGKPCSS